MRLPACSILLGLVLISTAAFADSPPPAALALVRPTAKGSHPLAAAVDVTRMDNGKYAGAAYFEALSPEMRKTLEKEGEVLMGDEAAGSSTYGGYIRAVAIFKQPKKKVWELMVQPETQPLFLPHLVSANVAARPANGQSVDFVLKVMWSSFKYRVMHWDYPEQSRVEWALDGSVPHDVKSIEGYWQLFDLGPDTTIGEYGTRVDTGLAVPGWIQKMFAKSDIPKALTAFRKYMDSGGTWRRDGP